MLLLQRRQGSGCNQNLRADANACLRLAMTAEFCFRARGAERGAAAEGMGMELSVAPPWELGTAARPAAGFTAFRTLLRGLPWLFELGGAVRSSVRLLGFYCRTDRRTVGGDCCSFFLPEKKVSHHLPSEKKVCIIILQKNTASASNARIIKIRYS